MAGFVLPDYEYKSKRISFCNDLVDGEWNTLMDVEGPGIIKHIWITLPVEEKHFGRRNILRIFWDDEENPSVEAPLCDFFCVPMGMTGKEYNMNSYFISVLPNNGMNSYFPMPFGKRARIELFINKNDEIGYGFYFQADYEECTNGLPKEWEKLRFHAKYRMESPTEVHGNRYLILDAEGEGYFVGTSIGIRRIGERIDSWYHGAGDQMFIDGETDPYVVHGIGGEDYFGQSWGVDTCDSLYNGTPLFQTMTTDTRDYMNVVLYRFFVHDPVRFKSSFRHTLGAIGDSISSVAYWYQSEPHKEFYIIPDDEYLSQQSVVPRLTHDIIPEYTHTWNVFGPIRDEDANEFSAIHPLEQKDDLNFTYKYIVPNRDKAMDVAWKKLEAPRGFADFHVRMRPNVRTIALQTRCYGFALGYIDIDEDIEGFIRVGFDDRMRLSVNDNVIFEKEYMNGFNHTDIPVKLNKGRNKVLVKLSNTHNTNFKSWTFCLSILDNNKTVLKNIKIKDE